MSIDIETYSSVDITKSGLYKYVQSQDFEILLFAYSFDGTPVEIIDLTCESLPDRVISALSDSCVIKHAYNATFEWYCLSKYYASLENPLPIDQWRCTMLHGLYCGYPLGLGAVGKALGFGEDKAKLTVGKSLIKLFCTPRTPTTRDTRCRIYPKDEPQKWELFKEYCCRDVVAEMEIERTFTAFPVPDEVQHDWELDAAANEFGVKLDTDLIKGALYCAAVTNTELKNEAIQLTGLDNPNSAAQLKGFLERETGETPETIDKAAVSEILGKTDNDLIRRVLEIRQELSKTSVKKYDAMDTAVCSDGRLRGLLQYYGANRTGRWAGRLVQVQNLTKNHIETVDLARELVKRKRPDLIEITYGSVPDILSQLIRTAFIPSDGNKFCVADFSAIEARVIAWLAGEKWRQDVFATTGKIYEASASAMFGVPIESITKGSPLRQKGKVAELALGYGGASGALIAMGALNMGLTEDELPDIVRRWRMSSPRICDLWKSVEAAAVTAIRDGKTSGVRGLIISRETDLSRGLDFMTIRIPSDRKLYYANPHMTINRFGSPSVSYMGMNQETKKWAEVETFGGKLVENIIQAIARDCLAVSLRRLAEAGYRACFTVHDEVILDVPAAAADIDSICEIMGESIPWAPDLRLRADGFVSDYYKKD